MTNVTKIGVYIFSNTNIRNISMPNVIYISNYAFRSCQNLELYELPLNLQQLGDQCFYQCVKIAITKIPEGVTSLPAYVFGSCHGLQTIELPPNLIQIGQAAFSDCINLQNVDVSNVINVPTISASSFQNTTCTFLFRDQTQLDAYAAATNWSALASRFQIKGA